MDDIFDDIRATCGGVVVALLWRLPGSHQWERRSQVRVLVLYRLQYIYISHRNLDCGSIRLALARYPKTGYPPCFRLTLQRLIVRPKPAEFKNSVLKAVHDALDSVGIGLHGVTPALGYTALTMACAIGPVSARLVIHSVSIDT